MKVLIFSHMHPEEDMDGSILCAYEHAKEMAVRGIETVFIGGRKKQPDTPLIEKIKEGPLTEYLIDVNSPSIFSRTGLGWVTLRTLLDDLIKTFSPNIIHFHSIMPMGFSFITNLYSGPWKTVLTLHSYTPLCPSDTGLYADDGSLCDMADSTQCLRCYPDQPGEAFVHHRRLVIESLNQLDMLTTPGSFAKRRYVDAGIPADSIRVIRNGTDTTGEVFTPRDNDGPLRLGYVGRNSSLKGLNVLLAAMLLLPHELRSAGKITLSIFGPLNENDTATFYNVLESNYVAQVFSQMRPLKNSITLHGEFSHTELPALMQKIDCLIVPSVWWEVTPCVIQEAFACGKPVVCSDIGGMAEMVTDGVDGLHFAVGSSNDLKDKILRLYENKSLLPKLQQGIRKPLSIADMVDAYLSLYDDLLGIVE